ncbi:hypothetical protein MIR68_008386 [Amoeboaphelidium protococcarum]|nr:hypothetical protein MIR68_008386 [Amoeboaphelidium protococcarum]
MSAYSNINQLDQKDLGHGCQPQPVKETPSEPQEEKNALNLSLLDSPQCTHQMPSNRDQCQQMGQDGFYQNIKQYRKGQQEMRQQLKDQKKINEDVQKNLIQVENELSKVGWRLDALEELAFKTALMTILEVYFKTKMYGQRGPPQNFSLYNAVKQSEPGDLLSNTGISADQWYAMRAICVKDPSGRNSVVHDQYPDFEIAEKAYLQLITVEDLSTELRQLFLMIIGQIK